MDHVATAIGVFVGTNVDDLIVLTVLFLASRATGLPKAWQIWLGQYLGVGALVLISAVAAAGLAVVPDRWVGLAGLVPIALGVRGLLRKGDGSPAVATGLASVAGVTIANGADNIAVYTPIFRTIGVVDSLVMVGVFALGIAVWCVAGSWLGSHRKVVKFVERTGHWLVPLVFIAIGILIMARLFDH